MTDALNDKVYNFFKQFTHKHLNKGEILIFAGTQLSSVFYLQKGFVKQYTINDKGNEIILNTFKPGTYFPMSNALNDLLSEYYFEADSDIEVWVAPTDKVIKFLHNNPDILFDLLKRVYRGTDGIFQRMSYLMSGRAYLRLVIELLIQVKRFGVKINEGSFRLNFTEGDLAAFSGLTRETVSREMKELKDKGLIIRELKQFIIPDLNKLESELNK